MEQKKSKKEELRDQGVKYSKIIIKNGKVGV